MGHFWAEYLCSKCGGPVSFMVSNTHLLIFDCECVACGKNQIMVKNPLNLLCEGEGVLVYCVECGAKYKKEKPDTIITIKPGTIKPGNKRK